MALPILEGFLSKVQIQPSTFLLVWYVSGPSHSSGFLNKDPFSCPNSQFGMAQDSSASNECLSKGDV